MNKEQILLAFASLRFFHYYFLAFPPHLMKHFSLLALSAYFAFQPIVASAYFTSPQDLALGIRADGAPRSFTAEMHGVIKNEDVGDSYIAAWVSGKQAGTTLKSGSAEVQLTFDVSVPSSHVKLRAKMAMRAVNKNLFVQLQSLDGNYDDVLSAFTLKGMMKKWISIPLSDEDITAVESMMTNGDMNLNDMFEMTRTQTNAGSSYSLHITRDFLKEMSGMSVIGLHGRPNFHVTVDTNTKDEYLNGKLYFAAKDTSGDIVVTARAKRDASAGTIKAPANVITLEELGTQMGMHDWFGSNPLDYLLDMPMHEEMYPLDDGMGSSDDYYDETYMDPDPSSASSSSSVGRPSRRTLQHQYREEELARLKKHSSSSVSSYAPVGDYIPALPAGGLSIGESTAPVTIVEFGDYECPFCARFHNDTFPQIKKAYIDTGKVRFVYRNFPLSFHPHANSAALTVECTREQSDTLAWKVLDAIFKSMTLEADPTPANLSIILANIAGLNAAEVQNCVNDGDTQVLIDQDIADAVAGGINGTPSFWVLGQNGKAELIQGAVPYETFQKVLDGMLKR